MTYDYQGKITRQKLRKKLKQEAKDKAKPKQATGKGRRCVHCGYWIQRRELFYNGSSMGWAYIHVNTPPQVIDNITHVAEPRPIPPKG